MRASPRAVKKSDQGSITLSELYEGTTFCNDRSWFTTVDVWYRYSLTVILHYRLALTYPLAYHKFLFQYFKVWYGLPVALFSMLFLPAFPFYVILLEIGKRIHQLWVVDWTQAGPGSVFFQRPKGLLNSFIWDTYINVSMFTVHFLTCGSSYDAILHSYVDIVTTKNYWRSVMDNVGMRTARLMGRFKEGKLEMHHDVDGVDVVCKVENSFLGIGDKFLEHGKDFQTATDLEKICSEDYQTSQEVLILELVRWDPKIGSHAIDIVTFATEDGPKVLSCLYWGDFTSTSSHSATSGYCVDVDSGKIVSGAKWYSVFYTQQEMKHLGEVIPGVRQACEDAIEGHKEVLKKHPWMRMVGWDCMVMKKNEWVWFEGNFAGARMPRRIFLKFKNLVWAMKNIRPWEPNSK